MKAIVQGTSIGDQLEPSCQVEPPSSAASATQDKQPLVVQGRAHASTLAIAAWIWPYLYATLDGDDKG